MFSLGCIAIAAIAFAPGAAFAQVSALDGIVNFVVSGTPLSAAIGVPTVQCLPMGGTGACRLAALFVYAVQRGRFLIVAFAFLVIVIAGFRLVISQAEDALTTARRTVMSAVIGLFLLFISEAYVDALYGGFSRAGGTALDDPGAVQTGALIISEELMGILRWGETVIAVVAVGLLVVQAVRVLGSFGAEDAIRKAYRAVFSTVAGLLLLVFDRVIAAVFGYANIGQLPGPPNAALFITEIFGLVRLVLFFTAIVVIGVIVYAGLLMIMNLGNEELVGKSKTVLINALLGLALVAVSFVIVSTVILGLQ